MVSRRFIGLWILPLFILPTLNCSKNNNDPFQRAKEEMILHFRWRKVTNEKVLGVMKKVPREEFIPENLRNRAYDDTPLPIGEGQTISQPYIVAFMTQALQLKPTDKVLEIGTGSGYQAAISSELAQEVYTIEIVPELAKSAEERLQKLGYKNIHVKAGDGYLGWPEAAPFNAIILTASPPKVPKPLQEQLAEGGLLIVPLGSDERFQELVLYTKRNGKFLESERLLPVAFVPMTGKVREKN